MLKITFVKLTITQQLTKNNRLNLYVRVSKTFLQNRKFMAIQYILLTILDQKKSIVLLLSHNFFFFFFFTVCKHACMFSHSVVSDSVAHGLWPSRLLCPQDFLGKNTGMGCHFLLQGLFLSQGSNLHLLHQQVDSLLLSHWGSSQLLAVARRMCCCFSCRCIFPVSAWVYTQCSSCEIMSYHIAKIHKEIS